MADIIESPKEVEDIGEILDSTEVQEVNYTHAEEEPQSTEVLEPHTSEILNTLDVTPQDQDAEQVEEVEEEYEEEVEENGEVKIVIKTRKVKIEKSSPVNAKEDSKEEDEKEEEYEEEELDASGEIKIVSKKRKVKVSEVTQSRVEDIESFTEIKEEYEEEELDETGETKIVKKTRLVKIPKSLVVKETDVSYEEIEEEYEEKKVNESGELVTVLKKRVIKIPKQKALEDKEEFAIIHKKKSGEEIHEEELEEEEELEAEEIEEEELDEEIDEGDVEVDVEEAGLVEEEKKRAIKKKKGRKGKVHEGDTIEDEVEVKTTTKRKRRRKRRLKKGEEKSKSEDRLEHHKEDSEKEEEEEKVEAKLGEKDDREQEVSISSDEMRVAEEKAAIAQQFEILSKLRTEYVYLRKKNYSLTNKLIQYFKKQKMDHVFLETKEDPEMEQRYFMKLVQFDESNQKMTEEKLRINAEWESQRNINKELTNRVKKDQEEVMSHKREVASKLIDPRTGRTVQHDKTVEDLLLRDENQLRQLSDCRLIEIKLKHRIAAKKEERQMDHMGIDFNLMDFEKLSSLKEYYTDKIIERDIEIKEVSQKLAAMEDKLGNVKERLRQREDEIEEEQLKLERVSADLNKKREHLSNVKASRHKTEKNTAKIKQESGLLAYPFLLKDYEEKTLQLKDLTKQTDALKQTYKNGVVKIRKLRDTIRKKGFSKYTVTSSSTCVS